VTKDSTMDRRSHQGKIRTAISRMVSIWMVWMRMERCKMVQEVRAAEVAMVVGMEVAVAVAVKT